MLLFCLLRIKVHCTLATTWSQFIWSLGRISIEYTFVAVADRFSLISAQCDITIPQHFTLSLSKYKFINHQSRTIQFPQLDSDVIKFTGICPSPRFCFYLIFLCISFSFRVLFWLWVTKETYAKAPQTLTHLHASRTQTRLRVKIQHENNRMCDSRKQRAFRFERLHQATDR